MDYSRRVWVGKACAFPTLAGGTAVLEPQQVALGAQRRMDVLVPHAARKTDVRYALSNSFGFGGTNGALLFRRYEG